MNPMVRCLRASYRNLEEMMEERGVSVDHSTISRWAIRFLPLLEKVFRRQKRPVADGRDVFQGAGQRCYVRRPVRLMQIDCLAEAEAEYELLPEGSWDEGV